MNKHKTILFSKTPYDEWSDIEYGVGYKKITWNYTICLWMYSQEYVGFSMN